MPKKELVTIGSNSFEVDDKFEDAMKKLEVGGDITV